MSKRKIPASSSYVRSVVCSPYSTRATWTFLAAGTKTTWKEAYFSCKPDPSCVKVSIDNITCSARLRQSLFNRKLRFALYLKEISKFCSPVYYQVKYTPQVFPAAFFKSRHFGTVALFSSDKINIVGCKSFSQIEEALVLFVETIQHASSRIGWQRLRSLWT